MIKLNYTHQPVAYTESGQVNPIRWCLLRKDGEDSYENTTNVFKCRDYFNDFVVYKHMGHEFRSYGMSWNLAEFDEEGGMYVLVAGIRKNFLANIDNVIHAEFGKTWDFKFTYTPLSDKEVPDSLKEQVVGQYGILYFPSNTLVSTYRISVLTSFLRNCNTDVLFNSYDDILDQNFVRDTHINESVYAMFKERKYDLSEGRDYCWYYGSGHNSKTDTQQAVYIHDSGIVGTTSMINLATKLNLKMSGKDYYTWLTSLPIYTQRVSETIEHPVDTRDDDDIWDDEEEPCEDECEETW